MPTEYRLQRPGRLDLVFTGDLIAHISSKSNRPRWTELTLYRTNGGKYVVEVLGKTVVPGENERISVTVCQDVDCVRRALLFGKDAERLTDLALDLLTEAGEVDPFFADADSERI